MNPDKYDKCPKCGVTWIGEPIPEKDREYFGDSTNFQANIMGVEYAYPHPERYDGVSEYQCMVCKTRWGRWTGFELHDGEAEPRYGQVHVKRKGKMVNEPAGAPVKVGE